jgi:glycosyltransferase involved in cell wall biosynthesis
LRQLRADILCCNGYKPDILGYLGARLAGVPVISISHGWTGVTWKVRINELLDRVVLHAMDCTVCVSEAQAAKVRRALVPPQSVAVIRNAVDTEPFDAIDPRYGIRLRELFPRRPRWIVGAAGRLSQEKGFDQLIAAASIVCKRMPDVAFVIFGDGPMREQLAAQIAAQNLRENCILAGFRPDVERFLPHLNLAVLSSHTEGLPVAVLEAMAARLPVVATSVGGTPEVIEDGVTGYLVPPNDPVALARRINDVLSDEGKRLQMGRFGRQRIERDFTFDAQAASFHRLFQKLLQRSPSRSALPQTVSV